MSANGALLTNATKAASRAEDGRAFGTSLEVVLEPVSHPEMGEIRIGESLFAVGRTEPPFATSVSDAVSELSRRHARIFSEGGVAYIADLGSKNGTSVNGIDIREKMSRLREGDQIRFGKALSYRVHLRARADRVRREERLASLTLTPEQDGLGLQPIVITSFPFLISKADAAFSRYKDSHPEQVNYLSRRHAHVFLKDGKPFVEDLGSTNGTFINGKRMDEHAAPLKDGDVLAFGGHHFVYKVSLQSEHSEDLPTVTMLTPAPGASIDADKTTFVAAADSFLDIFCIDHASPQEDAVNANAESSSAAADKPGRRHGRFAIFLSELASALSDGKRAGTERTVRWGAAVLGTLAVLAIGAYLAGTPERELKNLIAHGDFAQAAQLASRHMEESPDSETDFGALGTEALLKADVPKWMGLIKAGDFVGAHAVIADMKRLGQSNPGVQPLVDEVEWVGDVEQFVAKRGGADVPPKNLEDEARLATFVKQWNDGGEAHQSAFATISSMVPAFRDRYAETLSHLRKLALAGGRKDGGQDDRRQAGPEVAPAAPVDNGSAGRP